MDHQKVTLFVLTLDINYQKPQKWIGWTRGNNVPVITIHGITQDGSHETINALGFLPYFYCDNPPISIQTFVKDINAKLGYDAVVAAEVAVKRSILGENPDLPYLKITVASSMRKVATIVEQSGRACYESNVDIQQRFMVDTGIVGGGWISTVPKTHHESPTNVAYYNITTHNDWSKVRPPHDCYKYVIYGGCMGFASC